MTKSYIASKPESKNMSGTDLDNGASTAVEHAYDSTHACKVCEQLKSREQQWWQARQHIIDLKERQMFWFGDNSLMMWLLWQLVSYVVVAIVLMLASKTLSFSLSIQQYVLIFALQTLVFIAAFVFKGNLANLLQNQIHRAQLKREQSFNEMMVLASDSLFPNVHAEAPLSLQRIYENNHHQLRLVSLHALLNHEIDAGRLILQQQTHADVLPLDLAEDELNDVADDIVYRSIVAHRDL
uniref:hypothetical protein n=1 Tax=uncultured Psychrobacter sp. TaxID=259303 RepID=UPI002634418F|nr:hypothetical protein [uncultured Psychrobacter sp.]